MSVEVRIASVLRVAAIDLADARVLANTGSRNAAYLLEQAAEKIIRAVLTSEAVHPGIKHELDKMVDAIPDANPLKPLLREVEHLGRFATSFRYPTAEGKIAPLPADIAKSIEAVQRALDEAASRFGVDLSKSTPATRPFPVR